MYEENRLPFGEVLELLFVSDSVPIQHLYRLSDMADEEMADFQRYWRSAEEERRVEIARHMADLSEENFVVDFAPLFSFMLMDAHAPVRTAALDGLWDCQDERMVEPIIDLMVNDQSADVKAAAARALAHFLMMAEWGQVPSRKVDVIFEALRTLYEDPETALLVRGATLEAMGPHSHPKVSEYISDSYAGPSPELQRSALFAMGTSADTRWVPFLLDEMESPYPEMRAEAARAAGAIGSSEAISQLSELIYDYDEDVASVAIAALGQIGGDQASRILEALLEDEDFAHLHGVVEEGLEEADWLESDFKLFSWSEEELEDASELEGGLE